MPDTRTDAELAQRIAELEPVYFDFYRENFYGPERYEVAEELSKLKKERIRRRRQKEAT